MNKLSKENKIIIGIVMVVLVLSVGYAIFSESINIGGTARASGEFNIIFNSVGTIKEEGSSGATAEISSNKKSLTVNVPKLEYPSAYVEVPVVIKNVGSIKAILKGIETVGLDTTDIKVSYSGVTQDEELGTNEERNMKIKVTWDSASTTIVDNITFKVGLNYEQSNGGVTTTGQEQSDLFTWDRPGIVSGLSEKGIAEVKANGGHLVIPEGVTEIASPNINIETGEGNFDKGFSPFAIARVNLKDLNEEMLNEILFNSEYTFIKSISLPSSLKKIGDFTFYFSYSMEGGLVLPNNLLEIGDYAFAGSTVSSITIGENVRIIGDGSFQGSGITGDLYIPGSVKTIGVQAFFYTQITTLRLSEGLERIGDEAFGEIDNLSGALLIPQSVSTIGQRAFSILDSANNKLTSISISKNTNFASLETHGSGASFYNRPTPTIR